jgi:hypothetical protein
MPLTISLRPNPTPTDGKKSLNAFPYDSLPPWHSIRDSVTIGYSTIQSAGTFNFVNMPLLRNWHTSNASSIYSTFVPSSYLYLFDGLTSTSIQDGGYNYDMFDVGNFINLAASNASSNVFTSNSMLYGTISTLTSNNFGFFITSRNIWPQVSLSFIKRGSVKWNPTGGIGSDGAGTLSNVSSTYTTNRGFTGRFWANQGYNQGQDPSIIYTWFTIESTAWNTLISSSTNGLAVGAAPPDPMNQFMQVNGSNYMFGMFLLSVRRPPYATNGVGFFLSTIFIQNFLSNYVENATIEVT